MRKIPTGVAVALAILTAISCEKLVTQTSTGEWRLDVEAVSEFLAGGDTLVGDTVELVTTVTLDGEPVEHSGVTLSSSDPDVIRVTEGSTGRAFLSDTGSATVAVSVAEPAFGDGNGLAAEIDLRVSRFEVDLSMVSAITEEPVAADDALVGDTVQMIATVSKRGEVVAASGLDFASSDPAVVEIVDAAAGLATFSGTGQAMVNVEFDQPALPSGEPLTSALSLAVSAFDVELDITSHKSGSLAAGDTLLTDSVSFSALVFRAGGEPVETSDPTWSSSDPSIVQVLDPANGEARFAGTGQATVSVSFGQPELPGDSVLSAGHDLRVTTYLAELAPPPSVPAMGDTFSYSATVRDTRADTLFSSPSLRFTSSDSSAVRILDSAAGTAFARDTGTATVTVTLLDPVLPADSARDDVISTISDERFYGTFSATGGDFGDTVTVSSSTVHSFTDSSRVEFPDSVAGFMLSADPSTLRFVVPAGAPAGRLALRNLADDDGGFRDSVLTKIAFASLGTVDDAFESNDMFPLDASVKIGSGSAHPLPFDAILSFDPAKSSPADTNFFYIVPSAIETVDITLTWQVDADMDFTVCSGDADPPTTYVPEPPLAPLCARGAAANSGDRGQEVASGLILSDLTVHVIAVYCVDCHPTRPLTYRIRVE